MRRYFALPAILACLATALMVVPAQATTPEAAKVAALGTQIRRHYQAQGLQFVGYRVTTMQVGGTSHRHEWTFQTPPWAGNNRIYKGNVRIGLIHYAEPGDLDDWTPEVNAWATRHNDATGETVKSAANIDLASFSALEFDDHTETKVVRGTANPGDVNCKSENYYQGSRREHLFGYDNVMSYLGYVQWRFLTNYTDCSSLHLTNTYRSASLRVDIFDNANDAFDYEEAWWDNARTGMFAT